MTDKFFSIKVVTFALPLIMYKNDHLAKVLPIAYVVNFWIFIHLMDKKNLSFEYLLKTKLD